MLPGAIRDQLRRILASSEFHASEKRRRFLSFIVEETLEGRSDQLKGYTIAVSVFGRDNDFDSAHDPIVRIQAGILRRELERYYLVAGERDPIQIDIPKGRYVPSFVERPNAASAAGFTEPATRALGAGTIPSVAVMPLENLTQDKEQTYFLEGLVSELTMEITRYQEIIAIPCRGVGMLTKKPADAKALGAAVGARFLLGGSLRKDSERAKLTFYLADTATGQQVWSNAHTPRLDAAEVITTQETIAREVVATIAGEAGIISRSLSRESRKKKPVDLTTYEAILRYHHYMQEMTRESAMEAFDALQTAVEREPDYGPAWSAFANMYNHAYIWDLPGFTSPLETAVEYARKGAQLEPGNQLTRTVMAYEYLLLGELDSAIRESDVALSLNPNSPYFSGTIGYILIMAGDFERGRRLVDQAISINPCHPRWFHNACWLDEYRQGRYETAYREASMSGTLVGFWNPVLCASSLGQLGRASEARAYIEELRRLKPDFESRARELMARVSRIEHVVELIIDGLRKAGLKIE